MSNARFQTIPATTTLADLALIQANWDKADSDMTAETAARQAADTTEAQTRAAEDSSLQTQISAEQQARISADAAHAASTSAHPASNITFDKKTSGMSSTNVNDAAIEAWNRAGNIIAQSGTSSSEDADARTLETGYKANRTITLFGDVLRDMQSHLVANSIASVALSHGWNYLLTNDASPLFVTVQGVTRVNLLGKDGNFEVDSDSDGLADGWFNGGGTFTAGLSTTNGVTNGSKSQHFYPTSLYSTIQHAFVPDSSAYYLVVVDVNLVSGSLLVQIGNNTTVITMSTLGQKTYYGKFLGNDADLQSVNQIRFKNTTSTTEAYIDGLRIIPISADTYNKIDVDPAYTGDNPAARYPYVDSVQHLRGFMLQKPGKNLVKPFTDSAWTYNGSMTNDISSPYSISGTASTAYSFGGITIPILPNQTYTISFESGSGHQEYRLLDDAGNIISTNYALASTFTTPSNCASILIYFGTDASPGSYSLSGLQLELGSSATSFVERNDDFIYGVSDINGNPLKLAGDEVTGVCDTLVTDGSTATVTRRFKSDVVLDGSLPWAFNATETGYTKVYIPGYLPDAVKTVGTYQVLKSDGSLLSGSTNNSTMTAADQAAINLDGAFFISISDTDATGFDLTTQSGIQAYFAAHPYSLTYQLAQTVTETVTVEGAITSNPGGNQINVTEGVIVGEKANPQPYNSVYRINDNYGSTSGSYLKYRAAQILKVYKNGEEDRSWSLSTSGTATTNGNGSAYTDAANYDPTAVYTVDYVALDKYGLTSNATSVTVSYASTQKDIQSALGQGLADAQSDISILKITSARRNQGQWITPTMQNAWVNYGGTDAVAGYMKDDFGWTSVKGRIKSGTIGQTAFTLPAGYRPKETQRFAVSSNGAFGEVIVNTDGTIVPTVGSNVSFNVQIRFRAEQ